MTKSIAGLGWVAPVDAPQVALTRNLPRNGTTPRGCDVAAELGAPSTSGVIINATTVKPRARVIRLLPPPRTSPTGPFVVVGRCGSDLQRSRRTWRTTMGRKARVDLVLDCAEPSKLADFWRAALDYREYYKDTNLAVLVPKEGT